MKKKKLLVIMCCFAALIAVAIGVQGCKAQRTISATGFTIVSHEDSQKADSVRCSFKLEEKYSGVRSQK